MGRAGALQTSSQGAFGTSREECERAAMGEREVGRRGLEANRDSERTARTGRGRKGLESEGTWFQP